MSITVVNDQVIGFQKLSKTGCLDYACQLNDRQIFSQSEPVVRKKFGHYLEISVLQ
jgi:hypothetical protein